MRGIENERSVSDDFAAIAEVTDRLLDHFRGNIVGEGADADGTKIELAVLGKDFLQVIATQGMRTSNHHVARPRPACARLLPLRVRIQRGA
jgi:hypothetical protein